MNYLSAATCAKDEDPYLVEWVMFHRLMGVSRFYIYDNDSKVPISRLLSGVDHKDITVVPFPGRGVQNKAFDDAVRRVRGQSVWLMVGDVDEFFIPVQRDDLVDLLKDYEKYGGLAVNWQVYGSSGNKTKPAGFQFERYTMKVPSGAKVNTHVKSVVRPDRVVRCTSPHSFQYMDGSYAVNENGVRVDGPFSDPVSVSKVRVNHYFCRTEEEYKRKLARGEPNGAGPKDMRLFNATNAEAVEADDFATRFVPHLKAAYRNDRIQEP